MDPIDVIVGERIRARRRDLNLSQETLATAIKVSFQQLQKYEGATNRVSASRLYQIAKTLKVDPSYFFETPKTEEKPTYEIDRLTAMIETDEGKALNSAFQRIGSASLRKAIVELVQKIAAEQVEQVEAALIKWRRRL